MRANINWKLFFTLLALGILGSAFITPYITYILEHVREAPNNPLVIFFNQVTQAVIVLIPILLIGLILSKKIGFDVPYIRNLFEKKTVTKEKFLPVLGFSVGLGVVATLILIFFDWIFSIYGITINIPRNWIPPLIYRILGTFYGSINEEITYRLFVMSFVIFITYKIKSTKDKKPTIAGIWLGIIIAALVYSLTHLPTVLPFVKLTPMLILKSVVINGLAGIVYGFLFWKKGLESAMIAHWVTDTILQLL